MTMEEAIQILKLYRDEIGQRLDKADSTDVKDVYQWQMDGFDMAIEALSALPSADAVEVVRCKDCHHAEDDITHMFCVYFHTKVYEDDYCSNAIERRQYDEEYGLATEQMEHDALYEPTYNSEDGSM